MALTTYTAYKVYANIPSGTTTWDSLLTTLIAAAQAAVESYCGRPAGGFESATWTQARNGNGAESIWVPCWPVTTLTSVTEILSDGSTQALDSTTYRIGQRGEIARTGVSRSRFGNGVTPDGYWPGDYSDGATGFGPDPSFCEGRNNYSIVYVGGYASNAIPANLVLAIWMMVDVMFTRRGKDPAMSGESIEGYSYQKSVTLTNSLFTDPIKSLLQEWRGMVG